MKQLILELEKKSLKRPVKNVILF